MWVVTMPVGGDASSSAQTLAKLGAALGSRTA
jgi:hypothetical protein